MNLLSELVHGTLPSHHLLVTIDVSLYGVILTLHQLAFQATHAQRVLFHQRHTNAHVLILKRGAKLVLRTVAVEHGILVLDLLRVL